MRIGIIGAGAFGSALGLILSQNNHEVIMRGRSTSKIKQMIDSQQFDAFKNIKIPRNIKLSSDLQDLSSCERLIIAVPTQSLRDCLKECLPMLPKVPTLLTQKGIETGTSKLSYEIFQDFSDAAVSLLSGPNFAIEMAQNLPTATTIASLDTNSAQEWIYILGSPYFRPYLQQDTLGVALGGALKNVIAIACGIVSGSNLGRNAHAAVICRGLAEITRLGIAMGAQADTFHGLSGIGDLTLTCSSHQSRNMSFGATLGKGKSLSSLHGVTVEGIPTASSVYSLASKLGVAMPICENVYHLTQQHITLPEAIQNILERPFKKETM